MLKIYRLPTFILMLFISMAAFSQANLNNYKYIIVEKQFHFQNEPNENDFNSMVQYLFRKHGFKALIDGTPLPDDLKSNYCLALKSEITAKGALRTKGNLTLRDCNGAIVFASKESVTKEKNFVRAYDLVIRGAFESFNGINYKYTPNEDIIAEGGDEEALKQVQEAKKEIESLKAEIEELKEEKETDQLAELTKSDQTNEVKMDMPIEEVVVAESVKEEVVPEFTALGTKDGYELRSTMNRLMYTLHLTGKKDVYMFTNMERSGIVYKTDNGEWVMEALVDGNKQTEKIKINF
ncbi:MAG: hypothetical protein KJO77_05990 [Bacteroidia bacterium]|nr:hypothetical protein [Bacteroidia bacterium]